MKSIKSVCLLFFLLALTACAQFGRLHKEQPRVSLSLPVSQLFSAGTTVRDSVAYPTDNEGFTFVNSAGDSIPVGMSADWDSVYRENITTITVEEVVVSARSVRNTAERGGKINVEFVVTVPKELQAENWMLNVRPVLLRGDMPDSLKELRFSGAKFRESQERDYRRYDRFLESIIPDSVNFYHTFVNYRSFERYLERLKWYERGLEKRAAMLTAKMRRPDPLLQRFALFNASAIRQDSLLEQRMDKNADRMIARQWWRYNRSLEMLNDTLRYLNRHLPGRFRFFNERRASAAERLELSLYNDSMGYSPYTDSLARQKVYTRRLAGAMRKAEGLIDRKGYFRDMALSQGSGQVPLSWSLLPKTDRELFYSRFIYFNDRMESRKARLYIRYRAKGARAEGNEGIKLVKAVMAGRDTSFVLGRKELAQKYTRKFEMIKNLLPMFHFRRPEADSLPQSWPATAMDTLRTRRWQLAQFSEADIYNHYTGRIKPVDSVGTFSHFVSRLSGQYNLLPMYTFHRTLPDSVQSHAPGRRVIRNFERSMVDSVSTQGYYARRYKRLHDFFPQYNHVRALYNINPPYERYAIRRQTFQERIDRINSLDSASLVKMFYNTQKIARNEARKAIQDEKFREIVRFPFNPKAELDTVIYAADRVNFLYSEKVPADENSARMKVFLVGDVVSRSGARYTLPLSDTLTYLVSSMTKFVDKSPRFVRKIITRDAEANTSVDFVFQKNRFRLDHSIDKNRRGLKDIRDLTLALMTDPVYIIDSLTLFATSSPEGNWRINGEIAQKRAESIRDILVRDFRQLYDSLAIGAIVDMDETGNVSHREVKSEIPDLPRLIKVRTIPEDWGKLRRLIIGDKLFKGDKQAVLQIIDKEKEPDRREWLIKSKFKTEYAYMFDNLYPTMRAVDFRFSLSRRGMRQDTLYTSEPDTMYARAVEYLEKRKYEQALEILRPYEDVNTAIAFMSLGYDKAALRILEKSPETADTKYMQAILNARLGDERKAVLLLLSAADMNAQMKSRANLDPELSVLVKKYNLFKEEDEFDFKY